MFGFTGISGSVVFRICLFLPFNVYAANPYQLGQVDYFHENVQTESSRKDHETMDWNEHGVLPPVPVLALLENPTPQNARAYLAWQKLKINRTIKAQRAIDQALQEEKGL